MAQPGQATLSMPCRQHDYSFVSDPGSAGPQDSISGNRTEAALPASESFLY